MDHPQTDQEFACEDCGFTSLLTSDVCPNCNGRMTPLDAPVKSKSRTTQDGDVEPEDGEQSLETEEGGALSLESLQEQESKEDSDDDYGDGNA